MVVLKWKVPGFWPNPDPASEEVTMLVMVEKGLVYRKSATYFDHKMLSRIFLCTTLLQYTVTRTCYSPHIIIIVKCRTLRPRVNLQYICLSSLKVTIKNLAKSNQFTRSMLKGLYCIVNKNHRTQWSFCERCTVKIKNFRWGCLLSFISS